MRLVILFFFLLASTYSYTQTDQKVITVEDIWKNYTFYPRPVPGFNFMQDGRHYTRKRGDRIVQYDLKSGEETKVLLDAANLPSTDGFENSFSEYTFSPDEKQYLLATNVSSIYRRSTKGQYFVYQPANNKITAVRDSALISHPTFSPNGEYLAYVFENNLYLKNLNSGQTTPITKDGKFNEIINGMSDWVYEEEFGFTKAFQWSPEGNKIAFIRFDETAVKEFIMTIHHDDAYPEFRKFKYPKVGEQNAQVSVHIYKLKTQNTVEVELGNKEDIYVPRIKWTKDDNQLVVFKMNRHQNHLQLLLTDALTGKTKTLLEEKSKYYIDITDNLTFLKDGKYFLWTSEKDGYNHIYLYDMKGEEVRQVTQGKWDVTQLYGVDEKHKRILYQAAEKSPLDREIYAVDYAGKHKSLISQETGNNTAQFSDTYDYYILVHSDANTPPTHKVYDRKNNLVRSIEENQKLKSLHQSYGLKPVEFTTIKNRNGDALNASIIKPADFDKSKAYPVLMYVYGGPGSQTVENSYGYMNYWWFQMLAQKGYLVVSVDNRGTGARGEEFKKMTYKQLGKYETEDQIDAAKYLASLPYVDASRIGIFGWSYGGYMSSLAILKGNDVFKAAIAVAPVTNWKWYDSIYTERYMQTDDENPKGYRENSPVYFADQLKGSYLLVHGNADDNVHFQNTAEMANALIKANKQFDTYFYPNRNHGIYGDNARLHLYTKMTDFLLENL